MSLLHRLLNRSAPTLVRDGTDLTERGDQTAEALAEGGPQQPEITDKAEDTMDACF